MPTKVLCFVMICWFSVFVNKFFAREKSTSSAACTILPIIPLSVLSKESNQIHWKYGNMLASLADALLARHPIFPPKERLRGRLEFVGQGHLQLKRTRGRSLKVPKIILLVRYCSTPQFLKKKKWISQKYSPLPVSPPSSHRANFARENFELILPIIPLHMSTTAHVQNQWRKVERKKQVESDSLFLENSRNVTLSRGHISMATRYMWF